MESAASRTLNITELLEAILIEGPAEDFLLLQRVNKTWLQTISNSIELQRKLCFQPAVSTPVKFFYTIKHEHGYPLEKLSFQAWKLSKDGTEECEVRSNPLVAKLYKALRDLNRSNAVLRHLPAAWQTPIASWRRMLLTNVGVEAKFVVMKTGGGGNWEAQAIRNINTNTVRLGDIVDWVDTEYAVVAEQGAGGKPGRVLRILGENRWGPNIGYFSGELPSIWFKLGLL